MRTKVKVSLILLLALAAGIIAKFEVSNSQLATQTLTVAKPTTTSQVTSQPLMIAPTTTQVRITTSRSTTSSAITEETSTTTDNLDFQWDSYNWVQPNRLLLTFAITGTGPIQFTSVLINGDPGIAYISQQDCALVPNPIAPYGDCHLVIQVSHPPAVSAQIGLFYTTSDGTHFYAIDAKVGCTS